MDLRFISDLIFPVKCVICKKADKKIICRECEIKLESEAVVPCKFCGYLPVFCRCKNTEHIKRVFYSYKYNNSPIKSVIYNFKQHNNAGLNLYFAERIYTDLLENSFFNGIKIDIVTNVPRKAKSTNEFGYDQAKMLAMGIAKFTGIKYVSTLKTIRNYKDQKTLGAAERFDNIRGNFKVTKNFISGMTILLVDDVFTTGATIGECAKVLNSSGAEAIYAACIACV